MISSFINDIDILKEINTLLEYEYLIKLKKINKIKLTKEEYFFDTYLIKPSFMLKFLKGD